MSLNLPIIVETVWLELLRQGSRGLAERSGADKTNDDIQRSAEDDAATRTSVRRKQPRD